MHTTLALPARDEEHERVLSAVFDLSPSQSSALSCLVRANVVSSDELARFTGVQSMVKIVVSRTRKKIAEKGFSIKSKADVGYWIEPEDKRGIEKYVAEFTR